MFAFLDRTDQRQGFRLESLLSVVKRNLESTLALDFLNNGSQILFCKGWNDDLIDASIAGLSNTEPDRDFV